MFEDESVRRHSASAADLRGSTAPTSTQARHAQFEIYGLKRDRLTAELRSLREQEAGLSAKKDQLEKQLQGAKLKMEQSTAGAPMPPSPYQSAGHVAPLHPMSIPVTAIGEAAEQVQALTHKVRAEMGWGYDGAMRGLRAGAVMGAGLGLLCALFSAPHVGIAMMFLGPVLGLACGMLAQRSARKRIEQSGLQWQLDQAMQQLHAAQRQRAKQQGIDPDNVTPHVALQKAEALQKNLGGTAMGDLTQLFGRLLGRGPGRAAEVARAEDDAEVARADDDAESWKSASSTQGDEEEQMAEDDAESPAS